MTCLPAPDNSILIKTTSWQPRLGNGCRLIRVEGKFQKFILSLFNAFIFCMLAEKVSLFVINPFFIVTLI